MGLFYFSEKYQHVMCFIELNGLFFYGRIEENVGI